MRLVWLITILTLLIVGCSDDSQQAVYDTTANPHKFPAAALVLLDALESGSLVSYNQIVNHFADLYTENSFLLDSPEWKKVIDRLGQKFRYRADRAVANGLAGYDEAAGLYLLASFAQPGDSQLHLTSNLFSTWTAERLLDSSLQFEFLDQLSASDQLELIRLFELGDSLHRAFSEKYLRELILQKIDSAEMIDKMSSPRKALLRYIGSDQVQLDQPAALFEPPSITLVAGEVRELGEGWYQVDLYFEARSRIEKDYTIALHAITDPEVSPGNMTDLNYIPFDFDPVRPTSDWPKGRLIATAKRIYYEGDLEEVKVGLYQRPRKKMTMAPLNGSDESMYSLTRSDQKHSK